MEPDQIVEMLKVGTDLAGQTEKPIGRLFAHLLRKGREPKDHREVGLEVLRDNAMQTLANLELTVSQALAILGPDFELRDLEPVDSTWQHHWQSGAGRVGADDEERRTWWARLLAGEIQQPGTFSLRTLSVMNTLSRGEAQLFTEVCSYVWLADETPLLILPSALTHGLTDMGAERLSYSGLVKHHPGNRRVITNARTISIEGIDEELPPATLLYFHGKPCLIAAHDSGGTVTIDCGPMTLTDTGEEMFRLTDPAYPASYHNELLTLWEQSHNVLRFGHTECE